MVCLVYDHAARGVRLGSHGPDSGPSHRQGDCGSNEDFDHPRWSSDGTTIAALVGTGLFVVNRDGTGYHQRVSPQNFEAPVPEMSPDEPTIAYLSPWINGGGGGMINVINTGGTGQCLVQVPTAADLLRWAR